MLIAIAAAAGFELILFPASEDTTFGFHWPWHSATLKGCAAASESDGTALAAAASEHVAAASAPALLPSPPAFDSRSWVSCTCYLGLSHGRLICAGHVDAVGRFRLTGNENWEFHGWCLPEHLNYRCSSSFNAGTNWSHGLNSWTFTNLSCSPDVSSNPEPLTP